MLDNFFSKPVQGSFFKEFRKTIMGWQHISDLFKSYNHSEERVKHVTKKIAKEERCVPNVWQKASVKHKQKQ